MVLSTLSLLTHVFPPTLFVDTAVEPIQCHVYIKPNNQILLWF